MPAVLYYICNSKRKCSDFVANRLSVIEQHCDSSQWRHVPSKLNPADLASRGVSVDKLLSPNLWLSGPPFLWQPPETWPSNTAYPKQLPFDFIFKSQQVVVNTVTYNVDLSTDRLLHRYSSLSNLLKTNRLAFKIQAIHDRLC